MGITTSELAAVAVTEDRYDPRPWPVMIAIMITEASNEASETDEDKFDDVATLEDDEEDDEVTGEAKH
ncbi:unnamed protein product [Clonostachys rhizophaga]|uniref:Uncharacterized protein n=1 Tax=Clonostachys rhizophaga TaxID=160324 RepID=A0A9N9YFC7_9HYPO|nr:unnamed protein product [Clonostachys rhizophaga]